MGWADAAQAALANGGFILLSTMLDTKYSPLLNFITRGMIITGALKDYYGDELGRMWLVMQKAPCALYFWRSMAHRKPVPDACRIHSAQVSTDFFTFAVLQFSIRGLLVVDICAGSGSAAIACSRVGREYIGSDHSLNMVGKANARLFGRHYKCV